MLSHNILLLPCFPGLIHEVRVHMVVLLFAVGERVWNEDSLTYSNPFQSSIDLLEENLVAWEEAALADHEALDNAAPRHGAAGPNYEKRVASAIKQSHNVCTPRHGPAEESWHICQVHDEPRAWDGCGRDKRG